MTSTEVALSFVDAINAKDIEWLASLMADDYTFIDGDGSKHSGRERMKVGWKEHFELIPDLALTITEYYEEKDKVVLLGWSRGTIVQDGEFRPEDAWRIPCAWRVRIASGKVAVWQLYANQHVLHVIHDRIRNG